MVTVELKQIEPNPCKDFTVFEVFTKFGLKTTTKNLQI